MKKIFEKWSDFINEARQVKVWSTRIRIAIKRPEGATAVIDDTLALIRGIPSITVVNSDTDQTATTINRAVVDVEFKFIPRSTSVKSDLQDIKLEILRVSELVVGVSPIRKMLSSLQRVQ
tara:strand:- start:29 stop:388 length:360 start_codon:yes stop_codon:yes gene_type:complete